MPTSLTNAKKKDIPSLDILRKQAIEAGFSDVYERDKFADLVAFSTNNLNAWIQSNNCEVFVLKTDITPVSYGVYDTKNSKILGLYTAPEYEENGCASRILEAFIKSAKRENHDFIRVNSPLNATRFFEKKGFEKESEGIEQNLTIHEMKLEITS